MKIKEAIAKASNQLKFACERPRYEAELLMMHSLGVDRMYLAINSDKELEDELKYEQFVDRRVSHEPMEYITNSVSFYDIDLYVDNGALIPRPETEILIEEASTIIGKEHLNKIAEIGIGSGAISIVLARKFPNLQIVATDISMDAIRVAEKNINHFGLADQITIQHTSMLDGVDLDIEMIVSNPPYIPSGTMLAPNVAEYEPHSALFGLEDGDELLKEVILLSKERSVGHLVCEMGYEQKKSISLFASSLGITDIKFYKDYAGLDRGFVIGY